MDTIATTPTDREAAEVRCAACFDGEGVVCTGGCDHVGCHNGWWSPPRGDGLVHSGAGLGWVSPGIAFERSLDLFSGLD